MFLVAFSVPLSVIDYIQHSTNQEVHLQCDRPGLPWDHCSLGSGVILVAACHLLGPVCE
jgi:hypothetical protein